MRTFLAAAFLLVFLFSPLLAYANGNEYSVCQSAQDCIIADGTCPHSYSAINKNRAQEYQMKLKERRAIVKCMMVEPPVVPTETVCAEGVCALKADEKGCFVYEQGGACRQGCTEFSAGGTCLKYCSSLETTPCPWH